jgi:DNA replication and repair protein RecF
MITSLQLQNYRSFEALSLEFEPEVNIIVGPNASGKTNILEAILVVAQGKSYRVSDDELIRHNQPWARLEILLSDNTMQVVKLEKKQSKTQKTFMIDGNTYKRLPARYKLPVVVFEPNQLYNLTTSPELRRSLIDNLLDQVVPTFAATRRSYTRALMQRNSLLKNPAEARKHIFAWNVRLGELGGAIVSERQKLLEAIAEGMSETYSSLAGSPHTINLQYESNLETKNYANNLLQKLESNLERDIERGFTTSGPHRDDIGFYINDARLREFASRGEVRTTLLAFKVQEARLLEERVDKKPLMLLDDVFGELDGKRRKTLAKLLKNYQTCITTTDADIVVSEFANKTNTISLN